MASIKPTDSISIRPSEELPDCAEIAVVHHRCSPTFTRSDEAGAGQDIKIWPGNELPCNDPNNASCNLIAPPLCDCSDGIRSGIHRVDCGNGEAAFYVEPAPRSFTTYSDSTSLNVSFDGGVTGNDRVFVGPIRLEVKSACYPLRVEFTSEACAFRPTQFLDIDGFASNPPFWIGYAKWWADVNGQLIDLESQQPADDVDDASRVCEVYAFGGNINQRTNPYILAPNSTMGLNLEFRVRLEGPVQGPYALRINDARIRADITEVTSLASTEMDVC